MKEQGILQAVLNLDNTISLENGFAKQNSVKNPLLKSVDSKGNTISSNNINYCNYYNESLQHFPKVKDITSRAIYPFYGSSLKYVNLDTSQGDYVQSLENCLLLEKIDLKNDVLSGPYQLTGSWSLKQLPKLNLLSSINSSLQNFLTSASSLYPTDLDLSNNTTLKKLGIYGGSSHRIDGLKSLKVSTEAPFDNATAPQINVSYTGLDKTALINLFNSLPTVSNGQTISIIGCIGTSSLTNDDKAIATNKGWILQDS